MNSNSLCYFQNIHVNFMDSEPELADWPCVLNILK